VYGKLQSVVKTDATNIAYTYDAGGQRISKKVGTVVEWYVKDASGNTMATYKKDATINSGRLTTTEFYKYGSSLLGIKNRAVDMEVAPVVNGMYPLQRSNLRNLSVNSCPDIRHKNYAFQVL
jgi:YD repeat-containing protein